VATKTKQYRVIGALAQFTLPSERGPMVQYLYRGTPVPDGVDPAELAHNIEVGLVEEADPFDAMPEDREPPSGSGGDEDGPPAKAASKADWVAFAVAQGADEAEAEASTKDALIDQYGD
jgi:hypothetical protein